MGNKVEPAAFAAKALTLECIDNEGRKMRHVHSAPGIGQVNGLEPSCLQSFFNSTKAARSAAYTMQKDDRFCAVVHILN